MKEAITIMELEKIFEEQSNKLNRAKIKESISANEYKIIDLANRKASDMLGKILLKIKKEPVELQKKTVYR